MFYFRLEFKQSNEPFVLPAWIVSAPICRINFNFYGNERKLFSTFRAFAIMELNDLVGRLQVKSFIKNFAAAVTYHLLRHNPTSIIKHLNSLSQTIYT